VPLEIASRVRAGWIEVEVLDRGPGLPPGAETRVFEKFWRAAPGSVSGAGLGLAICRAIALAHGGSIVAENRSGGGACFRVTLPLRGGAPQA
jgi:two-component system sensor histidine kinase KdpD